MTVAQPATEQYKVFEINLTGTSQGNPYEDVVLSASFFNALTGEKMTVNGFYRGQGRYSIRFMPAAIGEWSYVTHANDSTLDGVSGSFVCVLARGNNHGRVMLATDVQRGTVLVTGEEENLSYRFSYEDGTPYQPYGTTCYAWTNQSEDVQEETLKTLAQAPFNKIRMCVFPKFYDFNTADPEMFAYEGSMEQGFDHRRFHEPFFENLDHRIAQLDALGIEADIILLHPYDKPEWGFSDMGADDDMFYLSYIARRYAAYKNVWWSFANEYDLMPQKSKEDWRRYARVVMANDPYNHLRSIHNCRILFDYNESWITHCSIQRIDVTRTTECVSDWRKQFHKPVIVDEPGYEGDIYWGWGNLTAQEETRRFWEGVLRGGYVTHGEVYIDKGEQLWWAHGGKLHGESPSRIGFLRSIMAEAPADVVPIRETPYASEDYWDVTVMTSGEDWRLFYFGFNASLYRDMVLPENGEYTVDVIDTWNMTIDRLPGTYHGKAHVDLGRKQYMAVRICKVA
ncbi:DUF5605 domain-containing protein [Bifidobacterium sp. LC6]|uniref:DUF5605 domain-containing protein n=1 Tax=Bifidobacterium colobi TaxID=2809026 RepID=A0ABS5UVJ7_9BIFI|nr:DUF5605 domain-containing protein [Bifidobacterium colobi]MBT1175030.1 DUF5605 domain-containing protein [Bifidobacterium colobi]